MTTIRTRIALVHGVLLVAVVAFCLALLAILDAAERRRVEQMASYEQLRAIDLVQARANRFSEQIAELFILGPSAYLDLHEARLTLIEAIEGLETLWRLESVQDGARSAVGATGEMTTVAEALDKTAVDIRALLAAGRADEAAVLFEEAVEHGLDRRMKRLIAEAAAAEERQVVAAAVAGEALRRRAVQMSVGLAIAVIALTAAAALFLNRNISRPIVALSDAADALGRGLAPSAAPEGGDELGRLGRRFNFMAAEIARSRSRLEQTVAERTRELSQRSDDLEQANERLRRLEAARARFFAEISHELRTPLTVIRTEAEVALRTGPDDPATLRDALEIAARKTGQMGDLVDNLMFLARLEGVEWTVDAEPVALEALLDEAVEDGAVLARPEGVKVRAVEPINPVIVRGDAARLRQVMLILLDNAVKFSPPDGRIDVELVASHGEAVFAVSDAGPGFTPDDRRRAFERMRRSGERTGSGLGLSIARWIVEKHGGVIRIDASPSGGARVEMRLPLTDKAA